MNERFHGLAMGGTCSITAKEHGSVGVMMVDVKIRNSGRQAKALFSFLQTEISCERNILHGWMSSNDTRRAELTFVTSH